LGVAGRELSVQDGDSEDEQDLMTVEAQSAQVVASSKEDIHQESFAAGDSRSSSSSAEVRAPVWLVMEAM